VQGVRLDKWLWAARFFKTRSLAQNEIEHGRVLVDGERVKVAREVRPGAVLSIRQGDVHKVVEVVALSEQRGPAVVAQQLYAETEDSIRERVAKAAARALNTEPANSIVGRPTKRDRRELERWKTA
jgi:ribosome-associated heat shock protein Hsp15